MDAVILPVEGLCPLITAFVELIALGGVLVLVHLFVWNKPKGD